MKRRVLLSLFALTPFAARAHGPTRQKVSEGVAIAAPPNKVWAIIKDFGALAAWNPMVESSPADHGNDIGSKRTVTLKKPDPVPYEEELSKYSDEGRSMMTFVAHNDVRMLPVTNLTTWLDVAEGEAGGSKVTWRAAFYRGYPLNDPPPELDDAASAAVVVAYLRAGLDNLKVLAERT